MTLPDDSTLKQRIIESLIVYYDYPRGVGAMHLRFIPVETDGFRHGLPFDIAIDRANKDDIMQRVADYLVDAMRSLSNDR